MSTWLDAYRPRRLDALDLHEDVNEQLKKLVISGEVPHLLFYGPPGAGKKTRIHAFLAELFGPGVDKVRVTQRIVETKSKKVEVTALQSNYHIEINPSDAGNLDTAVIQEVIKDIAQTTSVTAKTVTSQQIKMFQKQQKDNEMTDHDPLAAPPTPHSFKVIVLHEADKLTLDACHALRRTMETYTKTCRLIICTESATRIPAPLKSRCYNLRVPAPQDDEILRVCKNVLDREKQRLSQQVLQDVVESAEGNLRRALLALETTVLSNHNLTPGTELTVKLPDWETFILAIAQHIITQQSPQQLLVIRQLLYQLLTSCIPPDVILTKLTAALCSKVSIQASHSIQRWAAFYDERLNATTKSVVHLEAFVAKCMALLVYDAQLTKLQ